jgi:hypothetical protein
MNYKIRITPENQAIVKRIAYENGMNEIGFLFTEFDLYYIIVENKFWTNDYESDDTELTTEQFIEMFDKKETEWQPKRGDIVLVWDSEGNDLKERIFLIKIESAIYPIITVGIKYGNEFNNGEKFGIECYKHMKPLPIEQPIETDFKTKVIEFIEGKINDLKGYEKRQIERNEYYNNHSQVASKIKVYNDLINDIKQL